VVLPGSCRRSWRLLDTGGAPVERYLAFLADVDRRVAVAVVAALAVTYGLAAAGIPAWWVLPATVAAVLPLSLWRVARADRTTTHE
jgi:hypothetical protein